MTYYRDLSGDDRRFDGPNMDQPDMDQEETYGIAGCVEHEECDGEPCSHVEEGA